MGREYLRWCSLIAPISRPPPTRDTWQCHCDAPGARSVTQWVGHDIMSHCRVVTRGHTGGSLQMMRTYSCILSSYLVQTDLMYSWHSTDPFASDIRHVYSHIPCSPWDSARCLNPRISVSFCSIHGIKESILIFSVRDEIVRVFEKRFKSNVDEWEYTRKK